MLCPRRLARTVKETTKLARKIKASEDRKIEREGVKDRKGGKYVAESEQ